MLRFRIFNLLVLLVLNSSLCVFGNDDFLDIDPEMVDITNATESNPVQISCSHINSKKFVWYYQSPDSDQVEPITFSNYTYSINSSKLSGTYTCESKETRRFEAYNFSNPYIPRTEKSIIFYVGDTNQTIKCVSKSYDFPEFLWSFTYEDGKTVYLSDTDSKTYSIKDEYSNTSILTISIVNDDIRGTYTCRARNSIGSSSTSVSLKVHGNLVALWPFLGICCEILIMLAIMLVVRKRAASADYGKDKLSQNSIESSDSGDEAKVRFRKSARN